MTTSREPLGERVRALETAREESSKAIERFTESIEKITSEALEKIKAENKGHHEATFKFVELLDKKITSETDRWLKSFRWIAFAIMLGGMITFGNSKVFEIVFQTILKGLI